MKQLFWKLCVVTALCAVGTVQAQSEQKAKAPKVRIEWGLFAGINTPYFTSNDESSIRNKLGWQVGMSMGINWGKIALEPQIMYVRHGLKIRPEEGDRNNLRSSSIDVPILLSLRVLKPVRFFAGPVLTVMNNCKQKSGGDLFHFGRTRPTLSYTAGVGIVLGHSLIDLRYNGQFRSKHDVRFPDDTRVDKLRLSTVAISYGYCF